MREEWWLKVNVGLQQIIFLQRCGAITHGKLSVFATAVMSFYVRKQNPLLTDRAPKTVEFV